MAYNNTSVITTGTSDTSTSNGADDASIITSAEKVATRYTDINLQMVPHPLKRDIVPLKDAAAVKNAVRNLIISNFFERPFAPTLGANLRGLLFEPADAITKAAIKDNIIDVLSENEPRIENINILIETASRETEYKITVVFSIKEDDSVQDVEVNLKRLR